MSTYFQGILKKSFFVVVISFPAWLLELEPKPLRSVLLGLNGFNIAQ